MNNRAQRRRAYRQLGMLKTIGELGFLHPTVIDWRRRQRAEGKAKHEKMVQELENARYEKLEHRQAEYLKSMKEKGYNVEELKLLEEAWALTSVKDKETYRKDKKEAKRLRKEAEVSLRTRTTSND